MNNYRLARREYKKRLKEQKSPGYRYDAELENPCNVLEIRNLNTCFYTDQGIVRSVENISLDIPEGKTVGLVGESGCGKSVTSLSVMRLLPEPGAQIAAGEIRFPSVAAERTIDLARAPEKLLERVRGSEISMIFQEPMTSLNPVFSIGQQIDECVKKQYPRTSRDERKSIALQMLQKVGITRTAVYDSYPYELSGGMRQRIMITMALAGNPKLLIADEPTTALDVTIQAQILDLMRTLKQEMRASILLITHDLGVVAEMADLVVVMYAGRIVEQGTAEDIFDRTAHPYTSGLMRSKPVLNQECETLYSIPGNVPEPLRRPRQGCYFANRCAYCTELCHREYPRKQDLSPTHTVSCHHPFTAEQGGMPHHE